MAEVLSEFSLSSKDNVRAKLGENGWHRANEPFSRDQMSEQFGKQTQVTAAKAPKKLSARPFAAATVVLVGMILSSWH